MIYGKAKMMKCLYFMQLILYLFATFEINSIILTQEMKSQNTLKFSNDEIIALSSGKKQLEVIQKVFCKQSLRILFCWLFKPLATINVSSDWWWFETITNFVKQNYFHRHAVCWQSVQNIMRIKRNFDKIVQANAYLLKARLVYTVL